MMEERLDSSRSMVAGTSRNLSHAGTSRVDMDALSHTATSHVGTSRVDMDVMSNVGNISHAGTSRVDMDALSRPGTSLAGTSVVGNDDIAMDDSTAPSTRAASVRESNKALDMDAPIQVRENAVEKIKKHVFHFFIL